MTRVAFIGLGTMGRPMATRLRGAGHELVACDLDPVRAQAAGGAVAATPAEAATAAEVAIVSLPSPASVEEVTLGSGGLVEGLAPGAAVIDMSTSPPSLARELAAGLAQRAIEFLDAPVSGGPSGAEAGTLAVMVGGNQATFDRWRGLLRALGSHVERVGSHGAGQALKLANNLMAACNMAGLAEACSLLVQEGIDPGVAYEAFTHATADSSVLRRRFPLPGVRPEHPASGGYEPLFRLDLLTKDLDLALALAREHGAASPLAESARRIYGEALEAGLGELDYSAVYLALAHRRPANG